MQPGPFEAEIACVRGYQLVPLIRDRKFSDLFMNAGSCSNERFVRRHFLAGRPRVSGRCAGVAQFESDLVRIRMTSFEWPGPGGL